VKTGEKLGAFTNKAEEMDQWPYLKWSQDENVSGRLVTGEVQFFAGHRINNVVHRLKLPKVSFFALSPSPAATLKIAAFVPEKQAQPGGVRIFSYPSMDKISEKRFFKAQSVQMYWSPISAAVLAISRTDVDKTGKSYYGESTLHCVSASSAELHLSLNREGSIHDVAWAPNGKQFAVTYGFMPAQTTIFDDQCKPIADLGTNSRNTLRWSPNSRLVAVGGFGNLNGEMDIWDPKKLRKLATITGLKATSQVAWSPDSRYIVTAKVFPKIREGNGYEIWDYKGNKVHSDLIHELAQVEWRPAAPNVYPDRPPSPSAYVNAKEKETSSPAKPSKYVHPNAKGRDVASLRQADDGPVKYKRTDVNKPPAKQLPIGMMSKSAIKNQKRKEKKLSGQGNQVDAEETAEDNTQADGNVEAEAVEPQSEPEVPQSPQVSIEKKVKALEKKLKQIAELKEKAKTKELDASQIEKMNSEADVRSQLAAFKAQM